MINTYFHSCDCSLLGDFYGVCLGASLHFFLGFKLARGLRAQSSLLSDCILKPYS